MIETRLSFDIETMTEPELLARLPEPEVAMGNIKDPAKQAEKIKEAREKQIKRAALDPHFARVLAIGTAKRLVPVNGSGGEIADIDAYVLPGVLSLDDDEREMLRWFWAFVREHKRFVTFNGCSFDIPFLTRRSLLLGVRPARIDIHPFRCAEPNAEHLDLFRVLTQWEVGESHPSTLPFYVQAILNDTPSYPAVDKSKLRALWEDGQHELIKQMVGWDAHATLRLYEAVAPAYC